MTPVVLGIERDDTCGGRYAVDVQCLERLQVDLQAGTASRFGPSDDIGEVNHSTISFFGLSKRAWMATNAGPSLSTVPTSGFRLCGHRSSPRDVVVLVSERRTDELAAAGDQREGFGSVEAVQSLDRQLAVLAVVIDRIDTVVPVCPPPAPATVTTEPISSVENFFPKPSP